MNKAYEKARKAREFSKSCRDKYEDERPKQNTNRNTLKK